MRLRCLVAMLVQSMLEHAMSQLQWLYWNDGLNSKRIDSQRKYFHVVFNSKSQHGKQKVSSQKFHHKKPTRK
jgi:hypothetical protein